MQSVKQVETYSYFQLTVLFTVSVSKNEHLKAQQSAHLLEWATF